MGGCERRWPDLLSGRVATVGAIVVFVAAAVMTFVFIQRYALDILYADQWKDVELIHRANAGTLSFGNLWTQHNENRIFVPDLVVLLLGVTTHLQVVIEDYLSGAALCGTAALLVLAHRRRSPGVPLIAYCPVVLVLLSYVVVAEALFGFNLSWFLVLVTSAAALFLADRVELTRVALAGAVVAAVVASFSSLQGLLAWPAVLVLLWLRRRAPSVLIVWCGCAVVTCAAYFFRFDFAESGAAGGSAGASPADVVRFFVAEFGNVLGNGSTDNQELVLGAVVLSISVLALVLGWRRTTADGAAVGVALIVFGLGFVVSSTVGRAGLGLADALRYAPFVVVTWVGAYFVLLAAVASPTARMATQAPDPTRSETGSWWDRRGGIVVMSTFAVLVVVMGLQVVVSNRQGTTDGRGWRAYELTVANVTANIRSAPDDVIANTLGDYDPSFIRSMAEVAREERLSLFATNLAATQERVGLDESVLVRVARPADGAVLAGEALLDAGAYPDHVTSVEFLITGGGHRDTVVATGKRTIVGYLASWDTSTVHNGDYMLSCRATVASGRTYPSAPISVAVENPG